VKVGHCQAPPFKTLESFSFEGFVLCSPGKPGKRKEELTLLLSFFGIIKNLIR